jgi:hypothetical protein
VPAFDTEQFVVRDLFSDDYVFKFPLYQRPYRWGVQHAEALLNDILEAAGTEGKVDDLPPYFIGSIVLVKQVERYHLVIDGRQRLTTIAILLAVLRDLEKDSDDRDDLHEMLFDQEAEVHNIPPGPRLSISGVDGAGLMKWVIVNGATQRKPTDHDVVPERVELVVDVVGLFRHRLTAMESEQRRRLRDFLIRRCELVAVITPDENQGLRIFQVLNTRGLPLSDVDLIKPDLLTPLGEDQLERATQVWDDAETALGADGMSRLLRALYVIYARKMPPDDPKKFHEDFLAAARHRDLARVTLSDLPTYGDILGQIEQGDLPIDGNQDCNLLLRGLGWLGWTSEDYLPLAMEMLARSGDDMGRAYRWLRGLDRTCFKFFILKNSDKSSRDARREVFLKALNDLSLDRDPSRESGPLDLIPEERRRIVDSLNKPIETPFQRRALLQRLEAALTPGNVHPKLDEASCEHVLPVRTWRTKWNNTFDDRSHREHVNLLGNLVLLNRRHNELAGNKSYFDKKRILFKSNRQRFFETAKELRTYEEWTPEVIRIRTKSMAGTLAAAWEL